MDRARPIIATLWVICVCSASYWMQNDSAPVLQHESSIVVPRVINNVASTHAVALLEVASPDADSTETAVSLSSAVPDVAQVPDDSAVDDIALPPDALPARQDVGTVAAASPLSDEQWSHSEFEQLAAPTYETDDVLSQLPVGATQERPEPLSINELLAADQKKTPAQYTDVAGGIGEPFKMNTGDPALGGWQPLPDEQLQIQSTDFLDYDEEHNMVYGHGRVTLQYGVYKLTADRVMVDTRLREVQAYGNVVLASPNQHIEAESMWFDAENYQGVSYKSKGHSGDFYILSGNPHDHFHDEHGHHHHHDHGTTIRQVSRDETVLKDSSFTTCDFPVPHYRFKAKEFTIMASDRIFARNVVLYVLEKPVLWLPYFTRSMKDSNPWGFTAGTDGQLGAFARLFYDIHHSYYTPSDVDDDIMVKSSDGHARLRLDYFSKRGLAQGIEYSYYLDHGKHIGELFAYRLDDKERDIDGDTGERTYVDWYHRTKISEELDWMVNLDWASDPDIFFDTLDRVRSGSEWERGRLPERVAQTGFEWTSENFFAGLQVEIKDRIGRDRVSNFAEFRDGDFDFDRGLNNEGTFSLNAPGVGPDGFNYPNAGQYLDPSTVDNSSLDRGVSSNRYGRVSERLPHLTVSTNRLRLGTLPLWYHMDVNVFNNLDKGLNTVGTRDDSYVRGFDLYQSLSHLTKFSENYTWLNKLGVGFGVAEREDDSYNLKFPAGATFPYVYDGQVIDGVPLGLTFVDEETFLVGTKRMSLNDVEPGFAYADLDSRFNARLSDSLSAFVRYRFREGTDDNLGTFYEAIGSRKTMDDLYAFRTPEHWIEGGLTHALADPRLTANLNFGQNLQGDDKITPGEMRNFANASIGYANIRNTVLANAGVGYQTRQMRDPSDPFEFEQKSLTYFLSGSYLPIHQRHWGRLSAYFIQNAEDDPLLTSNDDRRNFDTRDEALIDARLGKKIGSKYLVEVRSRIRSRATDNQDTYVRIERDFHDLVAGLSVGMRQRGLSRSSEEETEDNLQVRFNVKFKPASQKGVVPVVKSNKLYDSGRSGFVAQEASGVF